MTIVNKDIYEEICDKWMIGRNREWCKEQVKTMSKTELITLIETYARLTSEIRTPYESAVHAVKFMVRSDYM